MVPCCREGSTRNHWSSQKVESPAVTSTLYPSNRQQSVSYMFDNRSESAPKLRTTRYRHGEWNLQNFPTPSIIVKERTTLLLIPSPVPTALQFQTTSMISIYSCVTRLLHFVKTKNLPFSTGDVKRICSNCKNCAELKPQFYNGVRGKLIKATRPLERMNIDFKGPLPTATRNKYILTVIDEYSRFPFAIPCADISTPTVIKCLDSIFSLCGMPGYIHSDRGKLSADLAKYLTSRNIATSHSTPYHPIGNGQVERYNGDWAMPLFRFRISDEI